MAFKKRKDFFIIIGKMFLIAFLLITPQLIMKSMIIGSDSIFHFNRFFDTASQIKNGNFQYFIHMYGFQQSGRIVNALYGPLMAYFQGLLVLISPSWFAYQLLSNFILYLTAGLSMYFLLIATSIKKETAFFVSIFFMTTFSIQYWIVRQGFTSWGAALLPVCLLPIIAFQKDNKFKPFQIGCLVALMTQVHMFTALILVLIYFMYFIALFFKKNINKLKLLFSLSCAVVLFILLTLNIWYGLFTIYKGNIIIPPFINKTMYQNTITSNSYYWLFNPVSLGLFICLKINYDIKLWKTYDNFEKVTSFLIMFFLLLTTNIVPWKFLSTNNLLGVNSIQFPFRFFVPFTVLLLFSVSKNLDSHVFSVQKRKWPKLILFLSILQVIILNVFTGIQWKSDEPVAPSRHQFIYADNSKILKQSFFSRNKLISLELVQKSTPDYLPAYHDDDSNNYKKYENYILNENPKFEKYINNNSLMITWEGEFLEERNIPVIIYQNTEITHNDEVLTEHDMQLSPIGTPILTDKQGENILEITYKESKTFSILLLVTTISWLSCVLVVGFHVIQRIRNKS